MRTVFACELRGGTCNGHDEIRRRPTGIGGTNVIDDCLFRCANKPRRPHRHLDDVHRLAGALVQFDAKLTREVVEYQVAAIERLQDQDLANRGLSSLKGAMSSSKTQSAVRGKPFLPTFEFVFTAVRRCK